MKLPEKLTTVTPLSKLLALLLFIILPYSCFFLGMSYQHNKELAQQKQKSYSQQLSGSTPTIKKQPNPYLPHNDNTYLIKHYTPEEKVIYRDNSSSNPKYSSLPLLQLDDKQIIPTKCTILFTHFVYGPYHPYFYLQTTYDDGSPVIDPVIDLQTRAELLEPERKRIPEFLDTLFCETNDYKVVVQYGNGELTNWGIWNENDASEHATGDPLLKNITTLKVTNDDEHRYFRCIPLFFTKENIFYTRCTSSNGKVAGEVKDFSYIYTVDLQKQITTLKYKCERSDGAIQCGEK